MAEFNPFDVPENGNRERPASAPQAPKQTPAQRPPRKSLKDRLPQNKFGNFLRRFWVPTCAVVVVALVLIVFGNAILVKLAPTWALGRGTVKTTKAVEDRIDASPYKALKLFGESMLSGSLGCEFTYYDEWSDAFGSVELTSDLKDLNMSLAADVTVDGRQVDGVFYLNEDRIALESSYLSQCYGVSFENFEKNLRSSFLGQNMSEEEIRQLSDAVAQVRQTLEFDMDDLIEAYTERYEEFLKEMDFQSSGEKTSVGGDRVSCTALTASMDEKMIRSLAVDCVEIFFENEDVKNMAISAMMAEAMSYGGTTEDVREEAERAYEENVRLMVNSVEDALLDLRCDIDITYYLYHNKLVKTEVVGDVTAEGKTGRIEYILDFGKDPAKDDWNIEYRLDAPSGMVQTAQIVYATDSNSKAYSDSLKVTIGSGWDGELEEETLEIETEWDKRSGDLEFYVYDPDGGAYQYSCNLQVDGKSFALTLDEFGNLISPDSYLELTLTADQTAKIGNPDYVDLDRWDESVMEDFENAANAINGAPVEDAAASTGAAY